MYSPKDSKYREKIIESFACQSVMKTINASISNVEPGRVSIKLTNNPNISQQHGFVHAGIISTVIDSACGYAARSLMPENSEVLTIEFKVNFLAPAKGDFFIAKGAVKKAGKTITVTEGELVSFHNNESKLIASMVATMMCLSDKSKSKFG